MLQQPQHAVEKYRKVLQIAADFTSDRAKTLLSVDKLQLIHTMHNLAEIITATTDVGDTLRDHRLKEDCADLQDQYMQKYIIQTVKVLVDSCKITSEVDKLEAKLQLRPGQWYSDLLDWITANDLMNELQQRIINCLQDGAYETEAA